jgi:transposase
MKNRYAKAAHFSEAKFRRLLRLFASDFDAAHVAECISLSRNSVNALYSKFRVRIAQLAEQQSCFSDSGEYEVDESYFGARRVRGKRGRGAAGKIRVFGIKQRDGRVYTQIVQTCSAAELLPIIKARIDTNSTIYSDEWKAYDGLAAMGYKKHNRVKHGESNFCNGNSHINGIENFWGIAKTRLAKFRGIRPGRFYLHLKETEFRFNNRQDKIYMILLKEFGKNPL